jgi:Raf kinase inhibitor-like YbhB/YbcL family protein
MTFRISSAAFAPDTFIPPRFTRQADNISPPREWYDAPPGTRSFVLVLEDPDSPRGTFRHWAVYDIPASSKSLKEGDGSREPVSMLRMGRNDFGNTRYDGPRPPADHGPHHYHFRILAVDVSELDVPPQSSVELILTAARARCLAEAETVGLFETPGGTRRARQPQSEPEPGATRPGIADADKLARTGSVEEATRQTPPAGAWNDVARNE